MIICPGEMWYQSDSATSLTATAAIDFLKSKSDDKLITRNGHVCWPPRLYDRMPFNVFLLSYVKSLVYEDKQATIVALETNIGVIRDIPQ